MKTNNGNHRAKVTIPETKMTILEIIEKNGFYLHDPSHITRSKELDGLLSNLYTIEQLSKYDSSKFNNQFIYVKFGNPNNL